MKDFESENLREEYTPKKKTNYDEAARLDRKAKLPALIFAYTFGIVGALVLGVGMCLAMNIIGGGGNTAMILGIIIGIVGIAMVGVNYPIYQKIMRSRKEKYSSAILVLLNKEENK